MQQSLEECQTYLSHNIFHHTIGYHERDFNAFSGRRKTLPLLQDPREMNENDNPSNDEKLKLNKRIIICAANNPGCLESDAAF
jgi:hypothetical protein